MYVFVMCNVYILYNITHYKHTHPYKHIPTHTYTRYTLFLET